MSWRLIGDEDADALTLEWLAAEAGVTKPVAYDHFGTRNEQLAALYEDHDIRQTALIDAAIAASKPSLNEKARVIASSYVNCVLTQGREIPELLAALSGSAELAAVKHQYQLPFIEKCKQILAPFAGTQGVSQTSLWDAGGCGCAFAGGRCRRYQ